MSSAADGYNPKSFREMSAWVGAAGAPSHVEVTFNGQARRGAEMHVQVDVTRALLAAWATLAFGMETLGLRYAESRRDTGLLEPGGALILSQDVINGSVLIGWETAQGIQVPPTPVERLLHGIADACRGQLPAIRLQAGADIPVPAQQRDHPKG
ncbi:MULTISPECIES: hypothetical protein [Achromobacter]|uniref:hypothetical protein n=1 Tax=Achromobacter TaxID=222 RepID=UPI0011AFE33F|nr:MULTISPECIES: hypothetical protein [Achromobacter]